MNFQKLCAFFLAGALFTSVTPGALAEASTSSSSAASSSTSSSQSADEGEKAEKEPANSALSSFAQVEQNAAADPETLPDLSSDAIAAYEPFMTTSCSATGHNLAGWRSNDDGTMTGKCTLCGAEETEDCQMEEIVVEPKCLIGGHTLHTCPVCSYTYTDSFTDPVGHNFVLSTDRKTKETLYTCDGCGIGFRKAHDSLGVTFMDGREFSTQLVNTLKDYLAEKDEALNEPLSADDKQLEEQDADEARFYTRTKFVKKGKVSDPEEAAGLSVSTDPVSTIAYLETLAFQNEDMAITEDAMKAEIDRLYTEWYQTSSEVITLPNAETYANSEDYQKDLEAALENGSTSSLRSAITSVAYGELGTSSGSKYINYYNSNLLGPHHKLKQSEPWCSEFVSWCLRANGVSSAAAPGFMAARQGVEGFESRGTLHKSKSRGGNYSPKAGDVVFFTRNGKSSHHTGLVVGNNGGSITTIEGNSDGKVRQRTHRLGDSYIYAYGEVKYDIQSLTIELTTTDTEAWCQAQWEDSESAQQIYDLLLRSVHSDKE